METGTKENLRLTNNHEYTLHTTIALQKNTKERLKNGKAPGQCYDGFIRELIDYWERYRIGSSLCGPGRPIRYESER
jgi:hypothetical protein